MGRTVRDANFETRSARLRLPIRTEPYWRGLEKGFALGYRRRGKGGTWLARWRQADGGYAEHRISTRMICRMQTGLPCLITLKLKNSPGLVASGGAARGRARHARGSANGRRCCS